MKKNIIICLLSLLLVFTTFGCGSNEEESNKEETKQSEKKNKEEKNNKEENKEDNKQEEKKPEEKKDDNKEEEKKPEEKKDNNGNNTVIDDEIIEIDDEDNVPPSTEGRVTVEEVINCEGCVYAYFSDEGDKAKRLGDTLSSDEYTTDINNIRISGNKQRHNFFGLVLTGNTISRAYSCILKDNKIYCIEGSTNGAYHSSNVSILNQIFGANQCKTLSDGHNYWCTDGSYNGNSKTSGYAALHYETSCTIYGSDANTGKLICH